MVLTVFGGLVLEMLPVQPDAAALRLTAPGSCTSSKRTERRWLTSQLLFPARRHMARRHMARRHMARRHMARKAPRKAR